MQWGVKILLAKILARRHLNMSDPYSTFIIIGDLEAHILLYYTSLEC